MNEQIELSPRKRGIVINFPKLTESQLKNMISEMFNQENSLYYDSIIICPQCPSSNQWVDTPWENGNYSIDTVQESNELANVYEFILNVRNTMAVDSNRFYVMGLSMGGFGTWDLIMRHTDDFAAAVCLCGGADVSQANNLLKMPIWAVHGTNDSSVPYAGTQAMCNEIINLGGKECTFESMQNYGHNVWSYAGGSKEIATWLFSQGVTE